MTKSQISISCIEKPVVATYGVQNYKIALDIIVYIFILQAAECDHAATNSVILYKTKSHTYIHIHLVIFTTYKTFTIYKSPIIVCLPKRNGALRCAAIYPFYAIYNPTNNGVFIKYTSPHVFILPSKPIPLLFSSSSRISQLYLPIHIKTKSTRVLFPHKSMCSRF